VGPGRRDTQEVSTAVIKDFNNLSTSSAMPALLQPAWLREGREEKAHP
jgi:hypothetical protein